MRFIAISLIGVVFLYLVVMLVNRIRENSIIRDRINDKPEEFLDYFIGKDISATLAKSVYEYLQDWMNNNEFPVRPSDDILDVYGIAEGDLDDLIIEIARSNDYDVPSDTDYWGSKIITVEDVIRFIHSFPESKA